MQMHSHDHGHAKAVHNMALVGEHRIFQEVVPARGHVTGAHQFLNLNITVQAELYFEEGELSSTKMSGKLFEQTKEEEKAGFE
jgi:hypothetical protein